MSQDAPPPQRSDGQHRVDAWGIIGYLLSGMLVWGGVGLLLDHFLHMHVLVVVGLLVGTAAATYLTYVRLNAR